MVFKKNEILNGWVNINKPNNHTSSDIVSILRKKLNYKKIGHAGTLDPFAEGVLPIAVGHTTKFIQYLQNDSKDYKFSMQLGAKTNTGDLTGKIIENIKIMIDQKQFKSVLSNFIGTIQQIPHKYSAIKINGIRAYDLARQGVDFEINSRTITIYQLYLEKFDYDNQTAKLFVSCSTGTYIRSLAEDIAKQLNTVAFLLELIRIRVGKFQIRDAINLDVCTKGHLLSTLQYIDLPILNINLDQTQLIIHGRNILLDTEIQGIVVLIYQGQEVAIGKIIASIFISIRVLLKQ